MTSSITTDAAYQSVSDHGGLQSDTIGYSRSSTSMDDTTPSGGRGTFILSSKYSIVETGTTDEVRLSDEARDLLSGADPDEASTRSSGGPILYSRAAISTSQSGVSVPGLGTEYSSETTSQFELDSGDDRTSITISRSSSLQTDLSLVPRAANYVAIGQPDPAATQSDSAVATSQQASPPGQDEASPTATSVGASTVDPQATAALAVLRTEKPRNDIFA